MGMSIEEAISNLSIYSVDEYGNAYSGTWYKGIVNDMENSFELAIDTMRKYQKIVQIMERTVDDGTSMYDTLQEIEEVIEDENDNR